MAHTKTRKQEKGSLVGAQAGVHADPLVDREIPSSLRGDLGAEFPETVRDFNPVMILGEPR